MKRFANPLAVLSIAVLVVFSCVTWSRSPLGNMTAPNKFFASGPQASLEVAVRADDPAAISRIVAEGADVNAVGRQGATPLMIAVDAQCPRAVDALLDAGALPNAKAVDRNGPVSLAVQSYLAKPHGREIMRAIFKGGGDPDSRRPDGDPVIFRFIEDHDASALKTMKALGANLDIRDRSDDPLITSVAMAQDWDMVWALIELGARFDYEGGASRQPLSMALGVGYPSSDSPLYPYKLKVWQLMKDKGLPVKPLKP